MSGIPWSKGASRPIPFFLNSYRSHPSSRKFHSSIPVPVSSRERDPSFTPSHCRPLYRRLEAGVAFWMPNCPPGFAALGGVMTDMQSYPEFGSCYCLASQHVEPAGYDFNELLWYFQGRGGFFVGNPIPWKNTIPWILNLTGFPQSLGSQSSGFRKFHKKIWK